MSLYTDLNILANDGKVIQIQRVRTKCKTLKKQATMPQLNKSHVSKIKDAKNIKDVRSLYEQKWKESHKEKVKCIQLFNDMNSDHINEIQNELK